MTQEINLWFANGSAWNSIWHFGTLQMVPLWYLNLATMKTLSFSVLAQCPNTEAVTPQSWNLFIFVKTSK